MKQGIKTRVIFLCLLVIFSFYFFLPSIPSFQQNLPAGFKKFFPSRGVVLGLDLQGGIHLVLQVDEQKAIENLTERMFEGVKKLLIDEKIEVSNISFENKETINIQPAKAEDAEKIKQLIRKDFSNLSPSLEAGENTLAYKLREGEKINIKANATSQALETIRNRIDQFGVTEPLIQKQGENEIVIQLPGIKDPKRAIDLIGKTALLEFKLVNDEDPVARELPSFVLADKKEETIAEYKDKIPAGYEILFEQPRGSNGGTFVPLLVQKSSMLTGDLLRDAIVRIDEFGAHFVSITFNGMGAKIFGDITGSNVGKRLGIVLDGSVHSAPVIQDRITGGQAQITGRFSPDEANDLAIVLRAGALPAPVKIIQSLTVGPSLGKDSIQKGLKSILVAGFFVVIFMVIYYKLSGAVAVMAMTLNLVGLLGAFAMFKATLTLPGLAGIVLTIGIGVDSNVLILERIREELRTGRSVKLAINAGYDKAFLTIVDSHITTLITAFVLFMFGTGPIKGFAVGLSLGIIINLFTALIGTKVVYDYMNNRNMIKRLSI